MQPVIGYQSRRLLHSQPLFSLVWDGEGYRYAVSTDHQLLYVFRTSNDLGLACKLRRKEANSAATGTGHRDDNHGRVRWWRAMMTLLISVCEAATGLLNASASASQPAVRYGGESRLSTLFDISRRVIGPVASRSGRLNCPFTLELDVEREPTFADCPFFRANGLFCL